MIIIVSLSGILSATPLWGQPQQGRGRSARIERSRWPRSLERSLPPPLAPRRSHSVQNHFNSRHEHTVEENAERACDKRMQKTTRQHCRTHKR